MKRLAMVLVLLASLGRAARADDVVVYRTSGAAPATSADDKAARTAALDEAFKDATRKAVEELASKDAIAPRAADVEAEVVKRARLWVASFKVVKQEEKGGTLTVSVDVKIDTAKLRDRLVELGVELGGGAAEPLASGDAPRTVTLLLRVSTIEGAMATYGAAQSDRVPAADDAATSLQRRGLSTVGAPGTGPEAKTGDGLPLSDDDARAYGQDVGAALVVIAGVAQGAPGPVRGAHGVASLSRATVRVVDVATGAVVGEGRAARGATGTGAAQVSADATRTALLEAIALALPRSNPDAAQGPALPLPVAKDGEVLVRVRGATGAQVAGVESYLAGAQGIKSVKLRRLGAGEVVLAVKGQRAERVGALIRGAADLGAKAKVADGAVEVTLP